MNTIVEVVPLNDQIVMVQFADGFTAELNVKPFIRGGISEKLNDPLLFKKVHVDEFGGISWPNGFDFCPNFLRQFLQVKPGELI
jgi:hypothetical protein